jgi:hypothetical protein
MMASAVSGSVIFLPILARLSETRFEIWMGLSLVGFCDAREELSPLESLATYIDNELIHDRILWLKQSSASSPSFAHKEPIPGCYSYRTLIDIVLDGSIRLKSHLQPFASRSNYSRTPCTSSFVL